MRRRVKPETQVEKWNSKYPIGTRVIYHPVIEEPAGKKTVTRSLAFVLSGHTACVFVKAVSGCVALDAVEVL